MNGWNGTERYESASNRPHNSQSAIQAATKNQAQEHLYIIGTYRCLTIKLLGISLRKL